MGIVVIIWIVLAVIIFWIIGEHNSIIKLSKKVERSMSSIDVYLTQRFDLIPNLVECVKEYMKYEKETLEEITKLRTKYMENKNLKDGAKLDEECSRIVVMCQEKYPELKANEQFLNLQKSLTKMEDQIQAARRIYNIDVTNYNTKIAVFPSSIIAALFGFNNEKELFKADFEAKESIKINENDF